ncbi:Gfo/Idh/MocA family protein [Paenactinomyces guangxiensis]|uniref:Gfo/Idh/MocA family oxidoreductase n=1 Tax=Paenactinomyces guangxiensis TaxID=1490290 RepID=A0A7W2A997_9BACL|nr:Gfo/Idh/MocA family oxidoreductase [Paenactinomyces guangxiensis]MBA4494688.1 Gfo/Idh/MocA family oxidoreductase [Paenactinomyces guangxiensis]MBH8591772.1 Gfo/Idh/MocA family oxidoreductase [Paenactinomyces guangxiensis]
MKLGIIGYGRRIRSMIDEMIKLDSACEIRAIADVRNQEIKRELGEDVSEKIAFLDHPEEMLQCMDLDGILIGTRCSLHAEMASRVLPGGIPLFLEKPVATNKEDVIRLKQGYDASDTEVVVSFPLRVAPLVRTVKEILDSGKIGTVEHVQAFNNVPYGGVYYHHWYRDENETGGLFLQKATHDFDYINYLLDIKPTMISAMVSKQIFKGNKPAGLKCVDCDEQDTCTESTVKMQKVHDTPIGEYCCFAVDTGNEDSGSALIQYETGMHVSYSQNFFARKKAAARGARLLGYKGTLEFDFYTNTIKVYRHHTPMVETYEMTDEAPHFGGDVVLAQNFIDVMKGKAKSVAPLEDGLLSAYMCLKASESAKTNTFQKIEWS